MGNTDNSKPLTQLLKIKEKFIVHLKKRQMNKENSFKKLYFQKIQLNIHLFRENACPIKSETVTQNSLSEEELSACCSVTATLCVLLDT